MVQTIGALFFLSGLAHREVFLCAFLCAKVYGGCFVMLAKCFDKAGAAAVTTHLSNVVDAAVGVDEQLSSKRHAAFL